MLYSYQPLARHRPPRLQNRLATGEPARAYGANPNMQICFGYRPMKSSTDPQHSLSKQSYVLLVTVFSYYGTTISRLGHPKTNYQVSLAFGRPISIQL
jgi:hypothetical protein